MATTVKPAGLTITRAGLKFTLTWKCADEDYDGGIEVQWRSWEGGATKATQAWTEWTAISVLRGETTASKSFSASSFFPTTDQYLFGVVFRVRGKRKDSEKSGKVTTYDWSAYAEKTLDLNAPSNPTVTQTLDEREDNVTTFSWNANASDTNTRPFASVEWQSILVENCNVSVANGSTLKWETTTLGWQTGTGSAEGSKTIDDRSEYVLARYFTRWFRIRSRGCGGNNGLGLSDWKYVKHAYSIPAVPTINSATNPGYIWYVVNWTANQNTYRPIDYVEVQWCIGYPDVDMGLTPTPSWNTAVTLRDSSGVDEAAFTINQSLELDECLWVQVVAHHDHQKRESLPYLVKTAKMTLPEDFAVEVNGNLASVSAAYNGNVPIGTTAEPNVKMAVICRTRKGSGSAATNSDVVIGLIYRDPVTLVYPVPAADESVRFGVYAFVGEWTKSTNGDTGADEYTINPDMRSNNQWSGGYVPQVPTDVTAVPSETPGEVLLTWTWPNWQNTNRAEVSWSKNPNAWESNKGPETYTLTSLSQARIRISELEVGVTWYFRIRLANETERTTTYGPYSDTVEVNLAAAPSIPTMTITPGIAHPGDKVKASWVYASADGTAQKSAEIRRVIYVGDEITYGASATVNGERTRMLTIPETWTPGDYFFAVHVQSTNGMWSDYSDPAPLIVAASVECNITSTSLVPRTVQTETGSNVTLYDLTALPLTVTATGAGAGGTTQVIIERADEYHMRRPDETMLDGYAGETIVVMRKSGQPTITITAEDLTGRLDDGAPYKLIVSAIDSYGQSDTKEIDFEVHWTAQAKKPEASVEMENGAAVITVTKPTGASNDDVCDIYRLSADLPQLIVEAGQFGTAYVDPYPAIGHGFGHRCVHRTSNGDYITAEMSPAWTDLTDMDGDYFECDHGIINFDGYELHYRYNNELSSTWDKDFQSTRYLGGSIVGDWNPGVTRQTTINAIILADEDEDFRNLRRLADYTGICHVRTPEGSSFNADVQVGDSISFSEAGRLVHATLTCTRIDPAQLDGMTYEEWSS